MKKCRTCLKEKELTDFRKVKRNRDGLSGNCKTCDYGHEPHKKATVEKVCTKCKELKLIDQYRFTDSTHCFRKAECNKCLNKRKEENRAKTHFYRRRDLVDKYGISLEIFNQMKLDQDNRCKICNNITEKLNVDHCHDTELVRGLLCSNCNWGLGNFKDNSQYLLQAIKYLQDTNTDKITI